ncbi:protein kinase domain-containing protein [Actinoallomurus sp. CA-150999]|uniref:protein kinase domain-containing protein n=1 Tax=Actinoallomurus sp. CA-150999 TaxID=3239887 RepID=UPI003D89B25E
MSDETSVDGQGAPQDAAAPMIAGRYRLVAPLGKGGMGTVWRAWDAVRGEDVAIKEPHLAPHLGGESREVMVARLEREARAAAQISHPAVVDILDVVRDSGRPLIVMELIKGRNLADLMDEGLLSPQQVAKVALPVAEALVAAHAVGVLHRDVKPHNIMIADDGRVVLTDFGLAQIQGEQALTATNTLVGSAETVPPERVLGRAAVPASDFFSLGVVLYRAVEGYSPFRRNVPEATFHAIMNARPADPIHGGPLTPLIMAMLDKDPEQRPSGAQVIERLRQVAEGTPSASTPTAPPAAEKGPDNKTGDGKRTRRMWVLPVAATIAVAAFAAGVAAATGVIKLRPAATQTSPAVTATATTTQPGDQQQHPTVSPSKSRKPQAAASTKSSVPHRKPADAQTASAELPSAGGPPWTTRVLHAPYVLTPGSSVRTNRIVLTMQTDGNLVLRDKSGKPIWATGTNRPGSHATLQTDGNLVISTTDNRPVWGAGCQGHDNSTMVLQPDANLVIKDKNDSAIWASNTWQ